MKHISQAREELAEDVESSPPARPGVRPSLATETYRLIARVAGKVLGRFEAVESVFIRRSVAAGEVSFGRSDIDLGIVIRGPLNSPKGCEELLSLNRCYRLLQTLVPVIGECSVHDPREFQRAARRDLFRYSLNRRASIVVYGKPLRIPALPIETEHAAWRAIFWFKYYLPQALRRRNLRNLRKFALEIWNAYAVAAGLIAEPCLTRREMEAAWRRIEGDAFPDDLGRDMGRTFAVCCEVAERLHPLLLPPLSKVAEPLVAQDAQRNYLILPRPGYPLPGAAFAPNTFVGTPEILDLFIHYVEPFSFFTLAGDLKRLQLHPPSVRDFIRVCPGTDPNLLRLPGFGDRRRCAPAVARGVLTLSQAARDLSRGEMPQPLQESEMAGYLRPPSYAEYYRQWYPRFYGLAEEAWRLLDNCQR